MNIDELRSNLQEEQNPVLAATDIGFFISDSLGNGSITLWEAFLLSDLQRDLLRNGYLKPAWSHSIGFSDLLSIIMLYVMSCYFNEPLLAAKDSLKKTF